MDPTAISKAKGKLFDAELVKLENVLAAPNPDPEEVVTIIATLRMRYEALTTAIEKAVEKTIADNDQDQFLAVEEFRTEFFKKMTVAERKVDVHLPKGAAMEQQAVAVYRNLPQRKLVEFTGDVRDWLAFWASFEDIHLDHGISDADKFQYLLQCIPKLSAARKCIDGFTVSAKNYAAAVDTLKKLYGRDSLLIKVYVRDLLELVIKNATDGSKLEFLDLYPKLSSHIRNLEELGVAQDKCENIVYPVVESCLPEDILQAWQRHPGHEEKLTPLMDFLNTEVHNKMDRSLAKMQFTPAPEAASIVRKGNGKKDKDQSTAIPTATDFANNSQQQGKDKKGKSKHECIFCGDAKHQSEHCGKAKTQYTVDQRVQILKDKRCCFRCLIPGHSAIKCRRYVKCCICLGNHFEIVCQGKKNNGQGGQMMMSLPQIQQQQSDEMVVFKQQQKPESSAIGQQQQDHAVQRRTGMSNQTRRKKGPVVLKTICAMLETPKGKWKVRIFVDGGSTESYIENWCAEGCGCVAVGSQVLQHDIFTGIRTKAIRHTEYEVKLVSLDGTTSETFVINSVKKITRSGIGKPDIGPWMEKLEQQGIFIPDQSDMTEDVQILLGQDVEAQIEMAGFYRINKWLEAKQTIFGWVVAGTVTPPPSPSTEIKTTRSNMVTSAMMANCNVEELWSLETLGITEDAKTQSKEDMEEATIAHFENTVQRREDGRYVVSMPFKEGHRQLTGNFNHAFSRLNKTTVDLKRQGYWENYDKVFKEWEELGIIVKADEDAVKKMRQLYLLPHRHVIKESSSTTPVRPVFDASAKGKGGPSLNDILEKGDMLELIPAIMCRFRKEKVGAVADIRKAFLQIEVARKDQNVLHFLRWTSYESSELQLFRHVRVVFGAKPSPFLLAATLKHHLIKNAKDDEFREKLQNSLYVDNSCSSHPTVEKAMEFRKEAQNLLLPAHFDLRGWEFSHSAEESKVPVLGMDWETKSDTLAISLESPLKKTEAAVTKRGLLALVNSVFDPLGYLCAVTISPKIWMQECAALKLEWDEPLPENIAEKVEKWKKQVPELAKMKIPRWLNLDNTLDGVSVHCFTDACGSSYACYVFVRKEIGESAVVQMVMGKSRVAPANKKMTIPRLELMGCQIGALLTANCVVKFLELQEAPIHFWTDSSTALTWITQDKEWARFVANRVATIRKVSGQNQWHHVPGELNPADVPSRGCSAKKLVESRFWEGPAWLQMPEDNWPKSTAVPKQDDVDAEKKKVVVSSLARVKKNGILDFLLKFSSFNTSLRVLTFVIRFIARTWTPTSKDKGPLSQLIRKAAEKNVSVDDLAVAEKFILRWIQDCCFLGIQDSRLDGMGAFMDDDGIIRIKSHLLFGREEFGVRCPIVLPHEHEMVRRIIRTEHFRRGHAGMQILKGALRERFWILRGTRVIGGVLKTCAVCKRFNSQRCLVPAVTLPFDRVKDTAAFDVKGVDLAGPLTLRGGQKVWIVLFTCGVYRAVHLELVTTLSTDGFLMAMQRFVARRGRPSTVYSDNGLNFVGSSNAFQKLDWDKVSRYTAVERIQWKFNPPTASWYGGWWERLIGLTKQLLRRILGKRSVDYEELLTILIDVEGNLNQRPLTWMSDEKEELRPLCPAYFLRDNVKRFLPEAQVLDEESLKVRAKVCAKLKEDLRVRFRREYLAFLGHRGGNKTRTVKVGDVVIVEDENKRRLDWSLGLIVSVYHGRDGIVRRALVKTKDGEFIRPVQRLFLLEMCENAEEEAEESGGGTAERPEVLEAQDVIVGAKQVVDTEEDTVPITRGGRRVKKPDFYKS